MSRLDARVGKRALDLVVSAAALPAAGLVMIPAAVAVRLEDGGPVLHVSTCLGRDREPFPLLKLRTTKVGAPDLPTLGGESCSAAPDDPSCTRVGRALRRSGIDRLPQLLNVLMGQMSLVGPRPSPPADQGSDHPYEPARYDVRPGLTGLSQMTLRGEDSLDRRCRLDAYYAEAHTFGGDLWVLWATVARALGGREFSRDTTQPVQRSATRA